MEPWVYIVLLGAVLLMASRFINQSNVQQKHNPMLKEIEDTFEHFSADLEQENKQLLDLVAAMKHEHESQTDKLLGRIEHMEQLTMLVSRRLEESARHNYMISESAKSVLGTSEPTVLSVHSNPSAETYSIPDSTITAPNNQTIETTIKSRYKIVFDLQKQGKSTEYIAKKLGMNKGEVLLITQLGKHEEGYHV